MMTELNVNADNDVLMIERLVPISDFSKGKTSHIFNDVKYNNMEYIILKNNQPAAVLISVENYKKIKQVEKLLQIAEEKLLYDQAVRAQTDSNQGDAISLNELIKKYNIDPIELEEAVKNVEIE